MKTVLVSAQIKGLC